MDAYELGGVKTTFIKAHGLLLKEHLFLSKYLYVVVICLNVLHLVNRYYTDIAAFADNYPVTLFRLTDFLC